MAAIRPLPLSEVDFDWYEDFHLEPIVSEVDNDLYEDFHLV